jgi:LacI family transcriptional regulator, galactose operon repressor
MIAGTSGDAAADASVRAVRSGTTGEWIDGYRQALADAGLAWRREFLATGAFSRADGHAVAVRLLASTQRPTAVLTTDGLLALGVLQAVRAVGPATPGDLSLVSSSDPEWAGVTDPPLTALEQPGHAVGVTAARLLIRRVRGSLAPAETRRLQTTWMERGSVARPGG